MSEVALDLRDTLVFSNRHPLLVEDVIRSLRALERIAIERLPSALSKLAESEVLRAELLVEGFESGSFREGVVCRLIFGSPEKLDQFIQRLRDGQTKEALTEVYRGIRPDMNPTIKAGLASSIITLLIGAGLIAAVKMTGGDEQAVALINGDNNVVIAITAEEFGKSPDEVRRIIQEVAASHSKRLAKNAVDVIAPAKREPDTTVSWGSGLPAVSSSAVATAPSDVDADPYEQVQAYRDVDIQIRALDRDKSNSGWAAVIPNLVDRRVRLLFADEAMATKLHGKFSVRGDVTVLSKMDRRSNQMQPVQI
nr:hypothetical protein [Thauera sp.]